MGGFGWHNGWPFEYGGGLTEDEAIYISMRNAVGEGGSAKDDSKLEGLWRQCRAQGLATLSCIAERAAMQAFPQYATDHIPVYEQLLGITPPASATDQDRRVVIVARYIQKFAADIPDLQLQLAIIDPRASALDTPRATSTITELGKGFQPQDGSPSYGGGRLSTGYPNYATEYYVPVMLNLGAAPVPGPADQLTIKKLKRFLYDTLPSWVDFAVMTGPGGFTLDLSPLDVTGMT